jgi:hypothetical protein
MTTARKPETRKKPRCACGKVAIFVCDHCGDDVCGSCFGANCCVECVDWEAEHERNHHESSIKQGEFSEAGNSSPR